MLMMMRLHATMQFSNNDMRESKQTRDRCPFDGIFNLIFMWTLSISFPIYIYICIPIYLYIHWVGECCINFLYAVSVCVSLLSVCITNGIIIIISGSGIINGQWAGSWLTETKKKQHTPQGYVGKLIFFHASGWMLKNIQNGTTSVHRWAKWVVYTIVISFRGLDYRYVDIRALCIMSSPFSHVSVTLTTNLWTRKCSGTAWYINILFECFSSHLLNFTRFAWPARIIIIIAWNCHFSSLAVAIVIFPCQKVIKEDIHINLGHLKFFHFQTTNQNDEQKNSRKNAYPEMGSS